MPEVAALIAQPESLARLKRALRGYVLDLFCGRCDLAYVENRLRIGEVHRRIGVAPKYYLAAMRLLREILSEFLLEELATDPGRQQRVLMALDRLLAFDTALVMDTYIGSLVGQVESASGTFHFLNIVGAGLPVDVMRFTDRLKVLGRSAYTLGTLWKAMQMHCYPLRIELDGRPLERDCLFVEIANTRYTGTSFLIAPDAEPDDGLLDVILVSRLPRRRVLQLFPSIYEGRHVEYDEVESWQAHEVRIVADEPLGLAPDGEICGEMPVTIRCLHRDLEVFAPARDERKD